MMRSFAKALRRLPLITSLVLLGCHQQKPTTVSGDSQKPRMSSGDQWRSWTNEEKSNFVGAYLDGYSIGSTEICRAIDESIPGGARIPKGTLIPLDDCLAARKIYSHTHHVMPTETANSYVDLGAYTTVIDDFYQHPDCRAMPYETLLEHLNDKEYRSGEDLYNLFHKGHIPDGWGAFSGFGGELDKCVEER